MKTKNLIIYIVICLIIIAGLAVWNAKGFRTELQYSTRNTIHLSNNKGIEKNEVDAIASEVLGNKRFSVQTMGNFKSAVSIVADEITEEQRNTIVQKFNEKYETEIKAEDVEIHKIAHTRVRDVIKSLLVPGIVTLAIVLVYFLIRFRTLGVKNILLQTLCFPIVAELLMFSLMAVVRIPFGRLAIALAVGVYAAIILALTTMFENQKNQLV